LATEKNLALKIELPNDLPIAYGDERRLTQAFLNVIGNAIKFTDSGDVAIKVAASNGAYTLSVRDTGPGIDPAHRVKIFDEFQQADNSSTKPKGGTGLGLSIAQRIVAMHGGRIWVESLSRTCRSGQLCDRPARCGNNARPAFLAAPLGRGVFASPAGRIEPPLVAPT
jgi:signal transduction histidine kinase